MKKQVTYFSLFVLLGVITALFAHPKEVLAYPEEWFGKPIQQVPSAAVWRYWDQRIITVPNGEGYTGGFVVYPDVDGQPTNINIRVYRGSTLIKAENNPELYFYLPASYYDEGDTLKFIINVDYDSAQGPECGVWSGFFDIITGG